MKQKKDRILPGNWRNTSSLHSPILDRIYQITRTEGLS
ncbi:hypothetical protein LEP1GSC074_1621 [Leptospira noguchii str. Hook]|nr:hypothetical protein LEP1GSC074_1621 [Leptospira noguchii str. Hook]